MFTPNALQRLVMWLFRIRIPNTAPMVVYTGSIDTFKQMMGRTHRGDWRKPSRLFSDLTGRMKYPINYTGATTGRTVSRDPGLDECAKRWKYEARNPLMVGVDPGKEDSTGIALVEFNPHDTGVSREAFAAMPRHVRDGHRARKLMRDRGFWKGVDPTTGITVDLLLNREACDIVLAASRLSLSAKVIEHREGWAVYFPTTLECPGCSSF